MKLKKTALLHFLLITVFFVAFHFSLHSEFDHNHDSSCSVYVLEQYFVGADIVTPVPTTIFFLPFLFILYHRSVYSQEIQKHFSTRAPPAL